MDSFSLFTFSPEGDVYSSRKVTLFPVSCTPKGEKITFCSFALDCSCQTGVSAAKHIDLVINPLRLSPEDTSGLHTAETSEVTVAQLEVKLLFQVFTLPTLPAPADVAENCPVAKCCIYCCFS